MFLDRDTSGAGGLHIPPQVSGVNNVSQISDITHSAISRKNSSVIQIENILNAKNNEEWTDNVLLAMIHNLSFDGSAHGHF